MKRAARPYPTFLAVPPLGSHEPLYLRPLFSSVPCNGLKYLTIGAYSPLTSACQWSGGRAVKQVIELALTQVNNRSDILPGYELQMVLNDTKVCAHY